MATPSSLVLLFDMLSMLLGDYIEWSEMVIISMIHQLITGRHQLNISGL